MTASYVQLPIITSDFHLITWISNRVLNYLSLLRNAIQFVANFLYSCDMQLNRLQAKQVKATINKLIARKS